MLTIPRKFSDHCRTDGTVLDLSLMFMLDWEYSGDDILIPSIMLMHMRTYNDPVRDFGDEMRLFDVDVQIANMFLCAAK